MATSRPLKTVDDFIALGDEVRAELIAGALYMTPSPTTSHQSLSRCLCFLLESDIRQHGGGLLYAAPLDVHLPSGDIVQPDLLYVREGNRAIVQDWIRGVPDLLIEIVSPRHAERDRIVKRDLYARNGVPEYWLVEGESKAIERLVLDGAGYAPGGYHGVADTLVTDLRPTLRLRVADVFAPAH